MVPVINRLAERFDHIALTQDWHPPGHSSFATSHPGANPFETHRACHMASKPFGPTIAGQGTTGAAFHPQLATERAELVIRKGFRPEIDSYSAFYENDRRTPTGLAGYLRERGLQRIFLAGLATDYCVYYSAVDARRLGFDTVLIEAGCRAIDLAGSLDVAWAAMAAAGVQRVDDLLAPRLLCGPCRPVRHSTGCNDFRAQLTRIVVRCRIAVCRDQRKRVRLRHDRDRA